MTIPNVLSLVRLLLIPVFLVLLVVGEYGYGAAHPRRLERHRLRRRLHRATLQPGEPPRAAARSGRRPPVHLLDAHRPRLAASSCRGGSSWSSSAATCCCSCSASCSPTTATDRCRCTTSARSPPSRCSSPCPCSCSPSPSRRSRRSRIRSAGPPRSGALSSTGGRASCTCSRPSESSENSTGCARWHFRYCGTLRGRVNDGRRCHGRSRRRPEGATRLR